MLTNCTSALISVSQMYKVSLEEHPICKKIETSGAGVVIRLERGTKLLVYGPADATATSSSFVLLKFRPIYLCVANLRRFHGKEFVKRTSVLKACSRCRDRNELNGNTYRSICELPVPFSSVFLAAMWAVSKTFCIMYCQCLTPITLICVIHLAGYRIIQPMLVADAVLNELRLGIEKFC